MSFPPLRRSCAALAAAAVLGACRGDAPTEPSLSNAPVTINAVLTGSDVRALTVLVTGPAIATPIVANMDVAADVPTASLTMQVPVGGNRTFVARGFDAMGEMTHEGMATVVVRPTGNGAVAIRMYPKSGDVPITIGVSEYVIELTPTAPPAVPAGEHFAFHARVLDLGGNEVESHLQVTFASLNPAVATIHWTGVMRAWVPGETTVYASFRGAAASVDVTVIPPPPATP